MLSLRFKPTPVEWTRRIDTRCKNFIPIKRVDSLPFITGYKMKLPLRIHWPLDWIIEQWYFGKLISSLGEKITWNDWMDDAAVENWVKRKEKKRKESEENKRKEMYCCLPMLAFEPCHYPGSHSCTTLFPPSLSGRYQYWWYYLHIYFYILHTFVKVYLLIFFNLFDSIVEN